MTTLVFYFAGHGETFDVGPDADPVARRSVGFLIPYDADLTLAPRDKSAYRLSDFQSQAIDMEWLADRLLKAKVGHAVVLVRAGESLKARGLT